MGVLLLSHSWNPPSFVGSMCPEIRPSLPKYLHALRPGLSPNITLHAFLLSLTVRKNLSITEEGIVEKRSQKKIYIDEEPFLVFCWDTVTLDLKA